MDTWNSVLSYFQMWPELRLSPPHFPFNGRNPIAHLCHRRLMTSSATSFSEIKQDSWDPLGTLLLCGGSWWQEEMGWGGVGYFLKKAATSFSGFLSILKGWNASPKDQLQQIAFPVLLNMRLSLFSLHETVEHSVVLSALSEDKNEEGQNPITRVSIAPVTQISAVNYCHLRSCVVCVSSWAPTQATAVQ